MTCNIWISQLFNGLSIGSILLLASLGLAFSFGLMKVINMAHGEFIMAGAYVTYIFQTFLAEPLRGADGQKEGLVFVLSIVAAFFIVGALGLSAGMARHPATVRSPARYAAGDVGARA